MSIDPSEKSEAAIENRRLKVRAGRILIAAIAAEVLGVIALVVVVALFGPSEKTAAEAYAMKLGLWVGPISGFVFCLLGGFWVARGLANAQVLNGFILGLAGAGIDIGILAVTGTLLPFELIFALSNVGRIIAGTLGGWFAARGV
jgi:hypothetical protein